MNKENISNIKKKLKLKFNSLNKDIDFTDFINENSYSIIKSSGLFDTDYYITKYPDVKANNIDSITHYLKFGVEENCNPNDWFSTEEYIKNYFDVAKSNINPFVHYILYGIFENRFTNNILLQELEKKFHVSIIMPTFNRKEVISDAIESVLNQTFQNFELLIIDDGSDDGTYEFILEKFHFLLNQEKIKYFKLSHEGVSKARNIGLKNAKGNVIAYLDSDNSWNFRFLEIMLNGLYCNTNFNCAYCGIHILNTIQNKEYDLCKEFDRKKLLESNFIDLNGFIHFKKLYSNLGGFDEQLKRLVDWDLIIRYTEDNNPLFVDDILVNYYIDDKLDNITNKEPLDKNLNLIKQKIWCEKYKEEYETIVDYFDQEYYLTEYCDVLKSNMHPLYHFLEIGCKEGRNPNKEFNTSFYVNKYSDVVKNGLNPLVHYAKWGEKEGRQINNNDEYNKILENNLLYLHNYKFDKEPLVSIIVLNRNGIHHLKNLFKNFKYTTNYSNYEIIIVDNASTDDSISYLETLDLPITIIKNTENVSFSKGNNDAVKIANGEYILLLNNDIEPTYGWLNEMMGTIISDENIGAVGAKLIYPFIKEKNESKYSFTIQHAGDIFRENINNGCLYEAHNKDKYSPKIFDSSVSLNKKCLLVTGAVYLIKKEIYQKLGGLDENYWYGYEDVDFNLRLYENNYSVVLAPAALLFHHESATPKKSKYINNHNVLCKKWGKFLFKNLLNDKIEKNYFFTDKKLEFCFITNHDFNENSIVNKCIHQLTMALNEQEYNTNLICDITNMKFDGKIDVLISFVQDFDINHIEARNNVIKILILNDTPKMKEYNNWDIIISSDKQIKNKLMESYGYDSVYYLKNIFDLKDELIPILQDKYLR